MDGLTSPWYSFWFHSGTSWKGSFRTCLIIEESKEKDLGKTDEPRTAGRVRAGTLHRANFWPSNALYTQKKSRSSGLGLGRPS